MTSGEQLEFMLACIGAVTVLICAVVLAVEIVKGLVAALGLLVIGAIDGILWVGDRCKRWRGAPNGEDK